MAGEEMLGQYAIPHRHPKGEYPLLFDALDGASNINMNVSVGTILSALCCPEGVAEANEQAFLQPGSKQVCAGFVVFGPSTVLVLVIVLTLGDGVHHRTSRRRGHQWPAADSRYPAGCFASARRRIFWARRTKLSAPRPITISDFSACLVARAPIPAGFFAACV